MYWYRSKAVFFAKFSCCLLGMLAIACEPDPRSSLYSGAYYPLHDFFRNEVDSLQRISPIVSKTVRKDDDQESKEMQITDWENELGAFLAIDLSKRVYQDAFEITTVGSTTHYSARDSTLDIRSVTLLQDPSGNLEKVIIERKADNFLYQNQEKLEYVRNRHYSLYKKQHIFLLGKSDYEIEGRF